MFFLRRMLYDAKSVFVFLGVTIAFSVDYMCKCSAATSVVLLVRLLFRETTIIGQWQVYMRFKIEKESFQGWSPCIRNRCGVDGRDISESVSWCFTSRHNQAVRSICENSTTSIFMCDAICCATLQAKVLKTALKTTRHVWAFIRFTSFL